VDGSVGVDGPAGDGLVGVDSLHEDGSPGLDAPAEDSSPDLDTPADDASGDDDSAPDDSTPDDDDSAPDDSTPDDDDSAPDDSGTGDDDSATGDDGDSATTRPGSCDNVPLRPGATPYDIAIDPADGDLFVLYDDGEIWVHEHSDWCDLTAGSLFGDLAADFGSDATGLEFLDVAANSAVVVTGSTSSGSNQLKTYAGDGTPSLCGIFIGSSSTLFDAWAHGPSGDFANDVGTARFRARSGTEYAELERYDDPDYCTTHFEGYSFSDDTLTGPSRIYGPYAVAVESDQGGDLMWWLENVDGYASRWALTNTGISGDQTFDGTYFGTGTQTDADNGWYDAQDLTRDNANRYFVLDRLSTSLPRIKAWTVAETVTTSIGGVGDTTRISGTPRRIEGSDFSGEIVVLHGDAPPYMVTVYSPSELP
jgi:hypothetical protein